MLVEKTCLKGPTQPPQHVFIAGCSESLRCTGRYELVPDRVVNGEPVWRKMNGTKWLHLSDRGDWQVSSAEIERKDFANDKSHLRCERVGCWPSDCAGAWDEADGHGGWRSAPKVRTSAPGAPPQKLFLMGVPKLRVKSEGYYELTDRIANGECIWQQTHGHHWLFLAPAGTWNVFNAESEEVDFASDRGVIMNNRTGCWPHECIGTWLCSDGNSWKNSKHIIFSVSADPPQRLMLTGCPPGRRDCEGSYVLQANRRPQGAPVWRQEDGSQFLFLGPNGKWHINGAGSERLDFETTEGLIYSERVGRWPHECVGSWSYTDGRGGWIKERGITFKVCDRGETRSLGESSLTPAKRARICR